MQSTYLDYYVLDHAAEYMFGDIVKARSLFEENPDPYVDAVCKLVQALVFSSSVHVPAIFPRFRETERLRSTLETEGFAKRAARYTDEERAVYHEEATILVRDRIWPNVIQLANDNAPFYKLLLGQALREQRNFFGAVDPNWTIHHYLDKAGSCLLSEDTRRSLLADLREKWDTTIKKPSDDDHAEWLDRNYASHYHIFAMYRRAHKYGYVPGITRAWLKLFDDDDAERVVQDALVPCIAYDILKSSKTRKNILEALGRWRDKHDPTLQRVQDLMVELRSAGSNAADLAKEVANELKRPAGQIVLVLNVIQVGLLAFKKDITGAVGAIVDGAKQPGATSPWWLLTFPGKGSGSHDVVERMRELLKARDA